MTIDQFITEIQDFVGPNLKLRPQDITIVNWLYDQPREVYLFIRKSCPYRMPENWKHWYEEQAV
jgi:hypothetical protein